MTARDWMVLAINSVETMAIITAIVYAAVSKIINVLKKYGGEE